MPLSRSSLILGAGVLGLHLAQAQQRILPSQIPPNSCAALCYQDIKCSDIDPLSSCLAGCPTPPISPEQVQRLLDLQCKSTTESQSQTVNSVSLTTSTSMTSPASSPATASPASSLPTASTASGQTTPPTEALSTTSTPSSTASSSSDHPTQAPNQQSSNPMDQNSTQSQSQNSNGEAASGLSTTNKVAIGVGVGVGVPLLALLLALAFLCARRRRNSDRGPYDAINYEKNDYAADERALNPAAASKTLFLPHQTPVHNLFSSNVEVNRTTPIEQLPAIERSPYNDTDVEDIPPAAATISRPPTSPPIHTAVSPRTLSPAMTPKRQSWSTIPLPPVLGAGMSGEPPSPVSPVSPMESRSSSFRRPG